jgi:molybdate transport system permease protein
VLCASLAAGLCVLLGVPLAWLLARGSFPGRRLLRALVTVPLVLPPVVGGVALFTAFGGQASSAGPWMRGSASRCLSPPLPLSSPRRSSRCPSS